MHTLLPTETRNLLVQNSLLASEEIKNNADPSRNTRGNKKEKKRKVTSFLVGWWVVGGVVPVFGGGVGWCRAFVGVAGFHLAAPIVDGGRRSRLTVVVSVGSADVRWRQWLVVAEAEREGSCVFFGGRGKNLGEMKTKIG